MHRLITGPAAALDDWLLTDIPASLAAPGAPRRVLLLSGAGLAGKRLEDGLTAAGVARERLQRHTLASLAERLLPAGTAPALPRDGDDAILRRLAVRQDGNSPLFAALGRPGLRRAVLRAIDELQAAGFASDADCIATLLAAAGSPECGNAELLRDLARLLRDFRAALSAAGYTDSAARLAAACTAVQQGAALPGPVYLHGHLALSGLERRLLRALAAQAPLTVLLPHDGTPACRWLDDERAFFLALGCAETAVTAHDRPAPLAHLLGAWSAEPSAPSPERGGPDAETVTIIAAPSTARELREAARAAFQAARAGVPPAEIAILFRDGATYRLLAHDTLKAAGIPHYLPGGLPLIETRAGLAVAQLLALAGPERRRADLLELLLTAPLRWEALLGPEVPPEPEAWDRLTREAGVTGGDARQWRERLAQHRVVLEGALALAAEDDPGGPRAAATRQGVARLDLLAGVLARLFAALDTLCVPLPWAAGVQHIKDTVRALLDDASLPHLDEVWPRLAGLVGLEPDDRPEALHAALTRLLQSEAVPVGVFGDGVFAGDLTNARGLTFDTVILAGVAERGFPAPPPHDPVLDDGARRAINAAAASLPGAPRLAEYHPGYDELLFHQALSAARRRLVLLYPFQDAEGRAREPSYLLVHVQRALPQNHGYQRISPERLAPDDPTQAISALEYDLAEVERVLKGANNPARLGYLDALSPDFAHARAAVAARAGHRYGAHGGVFAGTQAKERIATYGLRGRTLGATDIELYARCPRRYFFARVLRLEPLEEPSEVRRIRPDTRGTLVHAILEQFYRETHAAGALPLRPELEEHSRARLLAVAARCFAEVEGRGETGAALVWEVERTAIEEDLVEWLAAEIADAVATGLTPACFEAGFGVRNGLPPVTVVVDGEPLRFRARVDRIDLSRDGQTVRVVDYKSGRIGEERDGQLRGGTTMQLPIYLHAARALYPEAGGSAEYCYVTRAGAFRRVRFDDATLHARRDDLGQVLRVVMEGVHAGRFFPHPGKDGTHCRYCPYQVVCEARLDATCARRAADPDAASFLTLGDIA